MAFFSFFRKTTVLTSGLLHRSVDLHAHLLPGADEGLNDPENATRTLEQLEILGVTHLFFTPHIRAGSQNQSRDYLLAYFDRFRETYTGRITLQLAGEYQLDENFPACMENGLLTYDGQHFLAELPPSVSTAGLRQLIYEISLSGYLPVIAHPERYEHMRRTDYLLLKNRGCLFELDLCSLAGTHGKKAAKRSRAILKAGLYDFAGTGLHDRYDLEAIRSLSLEKGEINRIRDLFARNRTLWQK